MPPSSLTMAGRKGPSKELLSRNTRGRRRTGVMGSQTSTQLKGTSNKTTKSFDKVLPLPLRLYHNHSASTGRASQTLGDLGRTQKREQLRTQADRHNVHVGGSAHIHIHTNTHRQLRTTSERSAARARAAVWASYTARHVPLLMTP